jgi:membrane-bound lytic murein transglycosylase D
MMTPPAEIAAPVLDTSVKETDVRRLATDVFGKAAEASLAADSAPSWDIDVESYASTARVERYVRMFSGSAKERIESRLSKGTQYEAMIRGKMREGGIPEDMYYLALVESGFDPNAYSRAAAVGMWQFMTSTGRDMGLRIDWWVDERRDPFRSTTAAVRFLKGLNEQFGSLYLAAAAYNGGPGRVSRGLSRYADDLEGTSGDDLFFALADKDYFKNETREYVPQLIAAALIAKDPQRYGLRIESLPPIVYDSVRVGPGTPMVAVARAARVESDDLMALNTHVLRGITPPKDSFFVRVPAGKADSFPELFEALPKSERLGLTTVTSKTGQSLASIAKAEGLNARQLALYNPKVRVLKSGNLAPGQQVVIPTAAIVRAAVAVPDPSIERYGSSSVRAGATHRVKSGETLSGIAKRYGTTTAALMRANGLKRPLIFAGQSLVISGRPSAAPARVAKAPASKSKTPALATAKTVPAKSVKPAAKKPASGKVVQAGKAKPKVSATKTKSATKNEPPPKKANN